MHGLTRLQGRLLWGARATRPGPSPHHLACKPHTRGTPGTAHHRTAGRTVLALQLLMGSGPAHPPTFLKPKVGGRGRGGSVEVPAATRSRSKYLGQDRSLESSIKALKPDGPLALVRKQPQVIVPKSCLQLFCLSYPGTALLPESWPPLASSSVGQATRAHNTEPPPCSAFLTPGSCFVPHTQQPNPSSACRLFQ